MRGQAFLEQSEDRYRPRSRLSLATIPGSPEKSIGNGSAGKKIDNNNFFCIFNLSFLFNSLSVPVCYLCVSGYKVNRRKERTLCVCLWLLRVFVHCVCVCLCVCVFF